LATRVRVNFNIGFFPAGTVLFNLLCSIYITYKIIWQSMTDVPYFPFAGCLVQSEHTTITLIQHGGVIWIPILEGNIIFLTIYEPSTEILIIIA
jgi:hypothetical protein